jgi:hypothetical protein
MSDLTVLEVVATESEGELLCSLLRGAGIPCMQRLTNMGAGIGEGLPVYGPREILVRTEQLARARELLQDQKRRGV